jgi:sarcosine oxidase subunit beta
MTSEFLVRFANETVSMMPSLRHLRVIRQWTGICDRTPDDKPAVGLLDDGLYVTCGYHDYGMTMVPIVCRLLAETIISGTVSQMLKPFDPLRFE